MGCDGDTLVSYTILIFFYVFAFLTRLLLHLLAFLFNFFQSCNILIPRSKKKKKFNEEWVVNSGGKKKEHCKTGHELQTHGHGNFTTL